MLMFSKVWDHVTVAFHLLFHRGDQHSRPRIRHGKRFLTWVPYSLYYSELFRETGSIG